MSTLVKNEQKGSVLLWGLVILLTMTVIGIAAGRMAAVDSRIAGNQMMYMLTYQGAETALGEITKQESDGGHDRLFFYSDQVLRLGSKLTTSLHLDRIAQLDLMDIQDVASKCGKNNSLYFCDSLSGVQVSNPVVSMGELGTCPTTEMAMSVEMVPESGGLGCRLISIDVNAALPGTGAKSQHSEGRSRYTPAP